ncbi:MAG: YhbY family RNA-binding protein [Firmicutes bacterium]|nr:YhbY family RNA-binding protein [Bacillota bacterium]
MDSKTRAKLRSLSNNLKPLMQIGKDGLSDNSVKQIEGMLQTRQLIKISVLTSSEYTARELADALAEITKAHVISVVGFKFVLYRRSTNPKIEPLI